MARRVVDNLTLARWRELEAVNVLQAISEHAKQDADFRPQKSSNTTRWHASIGGVDFEIVCTGSRFMDTRAKRGGGGAVDMVMQFLQLNFSSAVAVLKAKQL